MSYVNRTLTALPFEHIIGSPLKAAIEAQSLAAKATVDFIQQVGFTTADPNPGLEKNEAGEYVKVKQKPDYGEVRNVVFKYTATNEDGTQRVAELSVPILTIIPIPYLRIDDMTIDFTANITETMESQKESKRTYNREGGAGAVVPFWIPAKVGFKASVSSSRSSSSSSRYKTEYTMGIHINAVQDDIPAGLNKVLNILESSIKETPSVGIGTVASLNIIIKGSNNAPLGNVPVLLIGHSNEPVTTNGTAPIGQATFANVAYGVYTVQINIGEQQFSEAITIASGTISKEIIIDYTPPA